MLQYFNSLFGEYAPVIVEYQDGTEEAFINFGTIANYVFIGIVLFCVCKTIGTLIGNVSRSISV